MGGKIDIMSVSSAILIGLTCVREKQKNMSIQ